jgi:DDE superfamily endonuclease
VAVFIPRGIVVFGLDDTIERRRGKQITAKGISRDPVRSSHTPVVKASGLRWLGCMVLTPIAWANRVWALPLLTVLCPSARCYAQRGRHHHTLLERAWQSIRVVRRWWPDRELVFVADSSVAALEWLALVARLPHVSVITRLRLDAALL